MKILENIYKRLWNRKRRISKSVKSFIMTYKNGNYLKYSFSQYGEDTILRAIFARYWPNYVGFYIDVGAHHPTRFSNSRLFYDQGWSGICIDPLPGSAKLFKKHRPKDVFLQCGVSTRACNMTYYMFKEPALNTFSEIVALNYEHKVLDKMSIPVLPLSQILGENLPLGKCIDYMSVDVEGMDTDVLLSNDWKQFRPKIVLIEDTGVGPVENIHNNIAVNIMKKYNYNVIAKTPNSIYFGDINNIYDKGIFLKV